MTSISIKLTISIVLQLQILPNYATIQNSSHVKSAEAETLISVKTLETDIIRTIANYSTKQNNFSQGQLNYTFKKCYCDLYQVRHGMDCYPAESETVMDLFKITIPSFANCFDCINFSAIVDNSCNHPRKHISVTRRFNITEQAELYFYDTGPYFSKDDYCLEVISDQQELKIEANICLPPPKLPFCCDSESCDNMITELSIAVLFTKTSVKWEEYIWVEQKTPTCQPEYEKMSLDLNANRDTVTFHFKNDHVHMLYTPIKSSSIQQTYESDRYCLERNSDDNIIIKFCYEPLIIRHDLQCRNKVCIRKCCPPNTLFDLSKRKCLTPSNSSVLYTPLFYDMKTKSRVLAPKSVRTEYDFPWCDDMYIIDPIMNSAEQFFLLENGSLFISLSNLATPSTEYCIDNFADTVGFVSTKAISCYPKEPEKVDNCRIIHKTLHSTLIIISCLFLAATLTVYVSLPELRANLHGKCLLFHTASLMAAFISQLVIRWGSKQLSMTLCKIFALCNQVSFLWAFFWLNVMCFDNWWTLKSMRPIPEVGESIRRRLLYYSIYAWGCPLVIVFITGFLEFFQNFDKTGLFLPGLGIRSCWFQDVITTWIYFHGFTCLLFVTNIFFFIHVAVILFRGANIIKNLFKSTKNKHIKSSNFISKHKIWCRVQLSLKLFIVMGITWICELNYWQEGGACIFWIITDSINSLQGVFIFLISMCNRKVYQKIQDKGIPFCKKIKSFAKTPSSTTLSSKPTTQTSGESSSRRLSSSIPLQ